MEEAIEHTSVDVAHSGERRGVARIVASPRWRVVLAVILLAAVVVPGALFARLCAEPLDISGTTRLPGSVTDWKSQDALAYPAHVVIGTVLDQAGCDPVAVALQWVKAGGHARTPEETALVGQALRSAAERAGSTETLAARLCRFIPYGFSRLSQQQAFDEAGLACPGIPRLPASGT